MIFSFVYDGDTTVPESWCKGLPLAGSNFILIFSRGDAFREKKNLNFFCKQGMRNLQGQAKFLSVSGIGILANIQGS